MKWRTILAHNFKPSEYARTYKTSSDYTHFKSHTKCIKHIQQLDIRFVFSWNYDRHATRFASPTCPYTCVQWWFYVHIRLKITINAIILSILGWSVFCLREFCFFLLLCYLRVSLFVFVLSLLVSLFHFVHFKNVLLYRKPLRFFSIYSHSIYVHARKNYKKCR